ncbi:HIRAN domain-containing protein [uncultured Peptoniphilus sp.]|uniref:HIRAN domain-containing protein n=1 Tax=uncultured Peptoniphilus sp. TaxID=254354 RepID=UPI002586BBFD|nr:HIRAN domain-containing protein [uncultured Peptoniphilus sp.]MDU6783160.1 HIRAN domain-containing protein [Peptoniphilus harei]
MSDLVKIDNGDLIEYLIKTGTGLDLLKPFERDIYLFDTYVAGTSHIEGIENIGESLKEGDRLVFYREPENEHDPQAIRIENLNGEKIGYVPRKDNVVFSRLMDAGKVLFAKVIEKEMKGKWLKIKIKIYLHES